MNEANGGNSPIAAQTKHYLVPCPKCGEIYFSFYGACNYCIKCGYKASCIVCGKDIPERRLKATKGVAKYCSHECISENHRRKYREQNKLVFSGIPSGTVGAINELRVSVDLLTRGYHVFRSLSPACICDLVIVVDHRAFRIEVTTGHHTRDGKLQYPRHDEFRYDVLAVVLPEVIIYFTDVPELESLKKLKGT